MNLNYDSNVAFSKTRSKPRLGRAQRQGRPSGDAAPFAKAQAAHPPGLAPWQLRLARDTLEAHQDGAPDLCGLAKDCGLSTKKFKRAFKRSTGLVPSAWLRKRRSGGEKDAVRSGCAPLKTIAPGAIGASHGVCDAQHLTHARSGLSFGSLTVRPQKDRRVADAKASGFALLARVLAISRSSLTARIVALHGVRSG